MPLFSRRRKAEAAAPASPTPEAPRAIVAAATRISNDYGFRQQVVRRQAWQTEAVRQYDLNGELRFAVEWMANSLSRIRLIVADVKDGRPSETDTKNVRVLQLVSELLGDPTCVAQIMHKFGQNLGVTGDVYLVYFDERWLVLSIQEIADAGFGNVTIWVDGGWYELPLASTPVIRIYRPHPFRCIEANSPTRGALPVLISIEQLDKYRNATVNSRLAGAGMLGIAQEISFAEAPGDVMDGEDPFLSGLAEAWLTPIADQGDPNAVLPYILRAPHEFLPTQDNWLVSPASELTTVTADLMKDDIVRLATALDIPTEVLTGSQDSSRWATWQTEETAIKVHVEPLVILICAALTNGFLKPLLAEAGLDIDAYTIWFDATELTARPNRGADAQSLYDKGLLSEAATRRENGFSEEDAPQGDEKCKASILEVLRLSPRFADQHLDVIAELMGWTDCGINPDDLAPPVDQGGPDGTPKQDRAPETTPQDRPLPDGGDKPNA